MHKVISQKYLSSVHKALSAETSNISLRKEKLRFKYWIKEYVPTLRSIVALVMKIFGLEKGYCKGIKNVSFTSEGMSKDDFS